MKKMLLISMAILLALALAVSAKRTMQFPHDFTQRECYRCHKFPERRPLILTSSIPRLCRGCHKEIKKATTHPVNMPPRSVEVPEEFPLRYGLLTCATCHDIHKVPRMMFGKKTFYLRVAADSRKAFCLKCHRESLNPAGHVAASRSHMVYQYAVYNDDSKLDPLSVHCISCHDNDISARIELKQTSGIWEHSGGGDHPVGNNYLAALMKNPQLAPVEDIDRRINLYNYKIGCGTCHSMYSKLPMKLVMNNDRGQLCTSCHSDK